MVQKSHRLKLEIGGDPSHGKKQKNSIGSWMLTHNDVEYYFNPGRSPDPSPIERIWDVILKEFVKKKKPINAELLLAIIAGHATQVTKQVITRLINKCLRSMPERTKQLLDKKRGIDFVGNSNLRT
jgi:transposase